MEQIINYKEYISFMESKKVRKGDDITNTLLDYVTPEQREVDKQKGINDLSIYDVTPKDVKEHFLFVNNIYMDLKKNYPSDKYLEDLANKENMQEIFYFYDWYTSYGVSK